MVAVKFCVLNIYYFQAPQMMFRLKKQMEQNNPHFCDVNILGTKTIRELITDITIFEKLCDDENAGV